MNENKYFVSNIEIKQLIFRLDHIRKGLELTTCLSTILNNEDSCDIF